MSRESVAPLTPERWKRAKELLASALERDQAARADFLKEACASDEALLREVQALLEAHARAGDFLDPPTLPQQRSPLVRGMRLGPYEIDGLLGAGGMGEVYRARDTRLSRDVALKILAARLAEDREALERFKREARAVAALSHPNILALHDVGEEDGLTYTVTELLEGETLRQRLNRGSLPPNEAVDIAMQTADGLMMAHDRGVVHRDIKPANLFLTRRGLVKILDFGLAKLTSDSELPRSDSRSTQEGVILGTTAYMSPEQARGLPVDHRSDIFSLGVVLCEMLSGTQVFARPSPVQTLAAVLTEDPPSLSGVRGVSPALEAIVKACLDKRPDARFQSAHDLALALRAVLKGVQGGSPPARTRRRAAALALLGLVAVAALAVAAFLRQRISARAEAPPARVMPLTSSPGMELQPALSPDGGYVAFAWGGESGDNFDIYNKAVGAETLLKLTSDPARDCCPAWSPDGRSIAFIRVTGEQGTVLVVPSLGGSERKVATLRPWFGSAVTWSSDGNQLVYNDRLAADGPFGLISLSLESLETRPLTRPSAQQLGDAFPSFSPNGEQIACARLSATGGLLLSADLAVLPAAGGEPRLVHREPSVVGGLDWTPDGNELVFSSVLTGQPRLWRVSLGGGPTRNAAHSDDPLLAAEHPGQAVHSISDVLRVSLSRRGHRLAYVHTVTDTDVWRVALDTPGGVGTKLIASTRVEDDPQYSPDSRRIAFTSTRGSPLPEIWVCNGDGTGCLQLTSLGQVSGTPRWSPDGRRIVFDSRGRDSDLYLLELDTRLTRRLTSEGSEEAVPSYSRDGRFIYFASDRSGSWQVWKMPASGGEARAITKGGGFAAFESDDGRWVYYSRAWSQGLWRVLSEGGRESRVLDAPRCWGYWALGTKGVYALDSRADSAQNILFHSFSSGGDVPVHTIRDPSCAVSGLTVSPDGRFMAYVEHTRSSDVMLIDGFR